MKRFFTFLGSDFFSFNLFISLNFNLCSIIDGGIS